MFQIHALLSSLTLAGSHSQPVAPLPATFQPNPEDEQRRANESTEIATFKVTATPHKTDAPVASPRSEQELPHPIERCTKEANNGIQATPTDSKGKEEMLHF